MDRGERIGLGVAIAGHLVLFGLLSVGFLATPNPLKLQQQPITISLVKDVGLEQTAPQIAEPAQSVAPEQGEPEEAAPPEPTPPEPQKAEPVPTPPKPEPAPQPKPAPPKPAPKPAPAPKPVPKPKPAPPKPAPAEKPAPSKPAAKPSPATSTPAKPAKPSTVKGTGDKADAKAARPRGSRLGNDFLKGLSDTPSKSKAESPPAQRIGPQALANIASAILRQVQPCANRQVTPGPGAERIRVTINLKLNPDGSLRARPTVVGHDGVDDENGRYVDRVDDLAIATFVGCSPLRGLPAELYDVPGGWSDFKLRYKLPG